MNSLTATKRFEKGDLVAKLSGQLCLFRTKHSIETQWGHIEDLCFSYMNHSFHPNVRIEPDGSVMAIMPIDVGDEILSDYTQHETEISHPFTDQESGRKVAK
jgi:hypothetical protein